MEDMRQQINSILQDPEAMSKLKDMAQSLGLENTPPPTGGEEAMPQIDIDMVQKLSGLVGKSSIDSNQRSLLAALTPYVRREQLGKLEKAMRAAKLASLASSFLGSTGLSFLTGR